MVRPRRTGWVAGDHDDMVRRPSRTPGPQGRGRARGATPLLLAVASGVFAMTLFVSLLGLFRL